MHAVVGSDLVDGLLFRRDFTGNVTLKAAKAVPPLRKPSAYLSKEYRHISLTSALSNRVRRWSNSAACWTASR